MHLIKKEKIQELFNYCRKFNFEVQLYSLDNTIQLYNIDISNRCNLQLTFCV